ncbi:MAG: aminotransferase class IV [bacterium]|nr:aminotransferase class IV [bacterium]
MIDTISINGRITSSTEGILPITSLEVTYGVGVYENIKVRNNISYFIPQHVDRILNSARLVDITHELSSEQIITYLTEYKNSMKEDSYNLKMILLAREKEGAQLYIMATAPQFPKKQWYRDGVSVTPFKYERWKPQAKTLNMFPSYYYYKQAKAQGAYDALYIDHKGNVHEGSRTNVFLIKDNQVYSPPKEDVLEGVTLMTLERVFKKNNMNIIYQPIPFDSILSYDGMFLTSTSTKVMPVKTVGDQSFPEIHNSIHTIREMYETALSTCEGKFDLI